MWVQQLNTAVSKHSRKKSRVSSQTQTPFLPVLVMFVSNSVHLCKSLQALLEFYNLSLSWQFKLVGEASSSEQATQMAIQYQPHLILLDLDLFEDPAEAIEALICLKNQLKYSNKISKILVWSSVGEENNIFHAMQAGACGYLLKKDLLAQLHPAITATLNNQVYLCPEVAARFFRGFHFYQEKFAHPEPVQSSPHLSELNSPNPYNLTNREREVLKLLIEGYRNQEIARRLYITVATVKAHLTTIFEKLGVDSRSRAIVRSLQLGLFSEESG